MERRPTNDDVRRRLTRDERAALVAQIEDRADAERDTHEPTDPTPDVDLAAELHTLRARLKTLGRAS